uniref:Putative mucin-5ac n=1 Tax=Anopheles triannulatus TaxID=58253 RepID=A0A2M4ADT8_9DIPT
MVAPTTTMKTHRMATVHLCGWCSFLLLLLVVVVVPLAAGLPITSKPLDNNPDHLTWEAAWLSEDNSRAPALPIGGKTKKITPKSIFITPFLNSYNTSACPPDYKVDYNGKCIQIVSINTADILVTKLQSLFAQHNNNNGDSGSQGGGTGEDDYDYDYDSTGPFQVNLPLSIDLPPELPPPSVPKLTYQDNLGPSYYDSAMVDVATVDQDKAKITTVSVDASERPFLATTAATGSGAVRPAGATSTVGSTSTSASTTTAAGGSDRDGAESQPDISFLAFESLPNGTLAGQIELDGHNRTVVQSIFVSSTTPDAAPTDGSSTTESTTTELDAYSGTPTDRDGYTVASESTVASSTTMSGSSTGRTDPEDYASSSTVTGASTTEQTTTDQEMEEATIEELKLELAEESLLLDTNHSSTVSTLDPLTTDVSDMMDLDTVPTSETEPSEQPTAVIGLVSSTVKSVSVTIPPPVRRTSVPAGSTRAPVQIITPIRGSWDLGYRGGSGSIPAKLTPASYVQQDRTTRATPETTTPAFERWTEKPPEKEHNDTKQEVNHQSSTTSAVPSTTTELDGSSSTTGLPPLEIKPIPTVADNSNNERYMEQLRKINEIVAEKRRLQQQQEQQLAGASSASTRIRFPSRTDEEPLSGAASSNSGVRFPGTATNRHTPSGNRLPDIFPKKSADSTTQRPAFWWLPSGWEVDQAGNKPMLLRFWSRMPLVRDNTAQPASNTEPSNNRWRSTNNYQPQPQHQQQQQHFGSNHLPSSVGGGGSASAHPVASARGNSKSPSENFYKEVSAQEVYKVMNARQLNQHQS